MVRKADYKLESDPSVAKKVWRNKELDCSLCPPNRVENAKRKGKHGTRKLRYKNKRLNER